MGFNQQPTPPTPVPYVMRELVAVRDPWGRTIYVCPEDAIMQAYRRGKTRACVRVALNLAARVIFELARAVGYFLLMCAGVYYLLWLMGY